MKTKITKSRKKYNTSSVMIGGGEDLHYQKNYNKGGKMAKGKRLTNVKKYDQRTKKGNFCKVLVGKMGFGQGFRRSVCRTTGKKPVTIVTETTTKVFKRRNSKYKPYKSFKGKLRVSR